MHIKKIPKPAGRPMPPAGPEAFFQTIALPLAPERSLDWGYSLAPPEVSLFSPSGARVLVRESIPGYSVNEKMRS